MNEDEIKIYYHLNEVRKNAGLKPLTLDPQLSKSAGKTNEHHIKNDATGSGDISFIQHIREITGNEYHRFGKISVMGSSLEKIVENIKKCSGKNSYIFDPRYTHIGTTVLNYYQNTKSVTVHFCAKD